MVCRLRSVPIGPARRTAPIEHAGHRLTPDALVSRLAAAQLGHHDAALGVDVRVGEQCVAGPLAENRQPCLEHLPIAHRNRQDVDRLVVAGDRVEGRCRAAHQATAGRR